MESIAVSGLEQGCAQLQRGYLYVLQSTSDDIALSFLLHSLRSDPAAHYFLISENIEKFFSSGLNSHPDLYKMYLGGQIFSFGLAAQFSTSPQDDLIQQLIKEINFYPQSQGAMVIFHLSAQMLINISATRLAKILKYLDQLAQSHHITMTVILTGTALGIYRAVLKQLNNIIAGMVVIESNATVHTIHYDYWHHSNGVTYNKEYQLLITDQRLIARPVENLLDPQIQATELLDLHDVLICQDVIATATQLPPQYQIEPDNETVYQKGLTETGATLIFAVTRDSDLKDLGKKCFTLRKRCGRWLKIVIKNVDGVVRHQDECLFLTIGVNLILHQGSDTSMMLSQIQAIQGFQFSRHLPDYFEDVLQSADMAFSKGYLPAGEFIAEVNSQRKSTMPLGVSGVLVVFELIPGIDPIHALRLFNIQRQGDLLSAATHQVYLYLHACRENNVPGAMARLFRLEIAEFFTAHRVYSQDLYIEEQFNILYLAQQASRAPDHSQLLADNLAKNAGTADPKHAATAITDFIQYQRPPAIPYQLKLTPESGD